MATHIDNETADLINTVVDFAAQSASSMRTARNGRRPSRMDVKPSVFLWPLLNRIRDLGIAIQSATPLHA
jgi:hypothetical protein